METIIILLKLLFFINIILSILVSLFLYKDEDFDLWSHLIVLVIFMTLWLFIAILSTIIKTSDYIVRKYIK